MDAFSSRSPEELLAQTRWLRALARRLLNDPADAEDVAQEALVAALEHPPALGRPLAPWLARVAANFARRRRRSDRRRREREDESSAPLPLPSPVELVESLSVQQDVVRAVLALEEPYRSTLLLHYFYELAPAEIAARQGIPAATVRQRLKRGRDSLRERLRQRYGGEGALGAALLSLAELPVRAASPPGGGAAAPGHLPRPSPGAFPGNRLVKHALVLLAASAVVAVSWLLRPTHLASSGRGRSGAAPAPTVQEVRATALTDPPPGAGRSVAGAGADEGADEALVSTGELCVRVRREKDGQPAAGEVVLVRHVQSPLPFPDERVERTDDGGVARFLGLAPGEIRLGLLRRGDDYRWLEIEPGRELQAELGIPFGLEVSGRVVDLHGSGIAGAEIWLSECWQSVRGHVLELSDERGGFHVTDVQPDGLNWLGARAASWAPSAVRAFEGHEPGDELEIEIVLDRPGAAVSGVVRDAEGTPVAGATVLLGFQSDAWARGPGGPPHVVATDGSGAFELAGVPPGTLPLQVRAAGYGACSTAVEIRAGAAAAIEIVLRPEATVVGRVLDAAGEPVARARIFSGEKDSFASSSAISAADGGFRLAGLSGGPVQLAAEKDGAGRAAATLELSPGEERVWDPALAPARLISGTLLDPQGSPVRGAELLLFPGAGESWDQRQRVNWLETDAAGRFGADVPDVPHTLLVYGRPSSMPAPILRGLRPGIEPLELRLPSSDSLAAIIARIVGPDGEPAPGAGLTIRLPEQGERELFLQASPGEPVEVGVPPGRCEVRAEARALPALDLGERSVRSGERVDLGTIQLPAPAFVRGSLASVPDRARPSLRLEWFDARGRRLGRSPAGAREYVSPPLGPGEFTLVAQGDFLERREERLVVEEGVDQRLDLQLETAGLWRARFELPAGAARPFGLSAEVFDAEGRLRWSWEGALVPEGPIEVQVSVQPGDYRVEARTDTGLAASGTLELSGLGGDQPPVELEFTGD